jgi:hypothetical protein
MRYEVIKITRDTNTVYSRAVPQWELPILEFIFGEGNVVPTDKFEKAPRDYPEARDEYERLSKKYGTDKETGTDFVATVYGSSRIGIREIGKAIEAVKVSDMAAARAARATRKPRVEVVDPLLN